MINERLPTISATNVEHDRWSRRWLFWSASQDRRHIGSRGVRDETILARIATLFQAPSPEHAEPGEWEHGWQYHASSSSEFHFRETLVLAQSCPADQAHLRSHSGPGASAVLHGAPKLLLLPSSKWHLSCFAPCFWKDFGCQCRSRTNDASVVSPSTHRPATEPRALGLEGCSLEHWDQNALWPECAGKQEPPCM